MPSELNDYDPGISLLHFLAQFSPQCAPARTCDQVCPSPSLVHLDVGEVDRTSLFHVPVVTVQSNAPSDDLSDCTGHAAAVAPQGSFIIGKNDCTENVESRCVMALWLHLRGVGYFLAWLARNFWTQRRRSGRQLCMVLKPVTHRVPRRYTKKSELVDFPPLLQTPSAVESEALPEICSPVPDVSSGALSEKCDEFQESRGAGTRGCVISSLLAESDTCDENVPLLVLKSA